MDLELRRAVFKKRYKRFFADAVLSDGETVTAHCANTGTMATLLSPDAVSWLRHDTNPKRKLAWTLTLMEVRDSRMAMVDTSLTNRIVHEGLSTGQIPELAGFTRIRPEAKVAEGSRIDFVLEGPEKGGRATFVEVKNVTMLSATAAHRADFPDAVTERGSKHLEELARLVAIGHRAVQFFLVSRADCTSCGIAEEIDPVYAEGLRRAIAAGVEVVAYRAAISPMCVTVGERCPFEFS